MGGERGGERGRGGREQREGEHAGVRKQTTECSTSPMTRRASIPLQTVPLQYRKSSSRAGTSPILFTFSQPEPHVIRVSPSWDQPARLHTTVPPLSSLTLVYLPVAPVRVDECREREDVPIDPSVSHLVKQLLRLVRHAHTPCREGGREAREGGGGERWGKEGRKTGSRTERIGHESGLAAHSAELMS